MILSAALRCVKVSHFDTQEILYKLSETAKDEYELISQMGLDEMHSFVPQMDIFASHHEKGKRRMFMN